jgi:hypothetical protein
MTGHDRREVRFVFGTSTEVMSSRMEIGRTAHHPP